MANILRSFKDLLTVETSVLYSNVLRLHFPFAHAFVMVQVLIATSFYLFGDPINCTSSVTVGISDEMIENYCYVNPSVKVSVR